MAERPDRQAFIDAVHAALTAKNEKALIECVKSMKHAGMGQEEVSELLSGMLGDGTAPEDEDQDDMLRDVLDLVVGWCGENQRLF